MMANSRQGSCDAGGFLHAAGEPSNAGVSREMRENGQGCKVTKVHSTDELDLMAGKSAKSEAVKCNSFCMNNYKFVTFLHIYNNIHEFPINFINASRHFTCSRGVLNNVYGTGRHSCLYIAGMTKINICRVVTG